VLNWHDDAGHMLKLKDKFWGGQDNVRFSAFALGLSHVGSLHFSVNSK